MSIYSLANRTSNTTTANAAMEIIAAASAGYRLLELGLTQVTGTAVTFGFGRPSSVGITPTTPVTVLAEDGGNTAAGNTQTALAFGTQPGTPANFLRRVSTPAVIGAGIVWTFPRGINVLKALSSVLWNIGATVALDVWIVVDE